MCELLSYLREIHMDPEASPISHVALADDAEDFKLTEEESKQRFSSSYQQQRLHCTCEQGHHAHAHPPKLTGKPLIRNSIVDYDINQL